MRRLYSLVAAALLLAASLPAFATVFATVHGVVHDSQHRPIAGAEITLQAADSDFALACERAMRMVTFELPQAPIGVYRLTVTRAGLCVRDADADGGLGHQPGAAYSAGGWRGNAIGGRARDGELGRYGDADDADYAGDDRRDAGREPHAGHGDDYRLTFRAPT